MGQAGNKSVGEDGGNADGKEREAAEEDSDDGELPAEAVSLPTSGLICNPQKKRPLLGLFSMLIVCLCHPHKKLVGNTFKAMCSYNHHAGDWSSKR